jgi:diguanylate cyclase (GGDEF)-like protein/PAS domain S-box-containing protein
LHRFDWTCIDAEGGEFIVDVSLMPIVIKGQTMLHTTWRDITERKRISDALEESRERYLGLSEAASEAIFISEKGVCLEQNSRAEEMFGYSLAEAIGRLGTEWIAPEDRALVMKNMMEGYQEPYEAKGLRKDGSTFPAIIRGRMMHYRQRNVRVTSMSDITVQKLAEDALKASEERWKFALEGAGDGVWDWNIQTGEALLSRRWKEMLGFAESEIENKSTEWTSRVHPEDMPGVMTTIQTHMDGKSHSAVVEFRMQNKAGHWQWILGRGMVVSRDADGKPLRLVGTNTDITERKAAADKIEHLAFYDPLTDLPNRRLLLDRLEQALTSCARHNRYGALMLLDMDDFKTLNDTLGHDIGDQFLIEVARRLQACVREGDTVARHGGDEFVVILEDLSEDTLAAMQAESVADKILRAVSQPYALDLTAPGGLQSTRSYHCTSSIGITLFQDNSVSVDELMKRTDTAMYQAKSSGRNTLRFFDPEMQAEVTARAALDIDLREAMRENQFCLYYQPQVDSAGNWTGAEALVRWQHPRRGMVSPVEFIPQSELTGMIIPLGQWVLETACAQLASWEMLPAMSHLTIAVNVSARQFRHVDFVDQVLAIIDRTGVCPTKLKLELTESLLLESVEDVITKMATLKAAGISFSLDDFGTGYSSLFYLKRLPLDQLKIDQSFVRDVLTDPNDATIARTIVALAQSMDLAVIAEGVETEAQREFLAANGCTAYQGYLFGRPMPIGEFLQGFGATAKMA